MKVVNAREMKELEQGADAAGVSYAMMMESAGHAVAEEIKRRRKVKELPVLILVGPGNNGGDGLVAARYLKEAGADVSLYLWNRRVAEDQNYRLARELKIPAVEEASDQGHGRLKEAVVWCRVLVDALLGTGASRPIQGSLAEVLQTVHQELKGLPRSAAPLIVAVDLPSGMNCDTGGVDPLTLPADITVTFAYPKRGLYLFPGAEYVGELVVADIGIPQDLAQGIRTELVTPGEVSATLPRRPLGAHKGVFGKALVIAGSLNYTGAAYLACSAASRVGAGLVTLAVAQGLYPILAAKLAEITFLPLPEAEPGHLGEEGLGLLREALDRYDVVLAGPGLGRHPATVRLIRSLVTCIGPQRFVLDADGLNALAGAESWWEALPDEGILTPHHGEMGRLLDIPLAEVEGERLEIARKAAGKWKEVVVLKGAYTAVATPQGQVSINPFANPGLATAGTGDVLAGAIAGFLAQGMPPYAAAKAGAYCHGLAGELVRQEKGDMGMVAGDLLPALPLALKQIRAL